MRSALIVAALAELGAAVNVQAFPDGTGALIALAVQPLILAVLVLAWFSRPRPQPQRHGNPWRRRSAGDRFTY